jgi:hypothetical protein
VDGEPVAIPSASGGRGNSKSVVCSLPLQGEGGHRAPAQSAYRGGGNKCYLPRLGLVGEDNRREYTRSAWHRTYMGRWVTKDRVTLTGKVEGYPSLRGEGKTIA